jgi:nitroreductase
MMMDILDVLTSRKSIRRYKPDPIPDEMLDKILEAARWAPTGENYQPWRLIVIRDPETKKKIGALAKQGSGSRMTAWQCLGEMQKRFEDIKDPVKRAEVLRFMYSGEVSEFAKNAPVVIAVIGSLMEGSVDVPYDLSACVENILLEAHSLGLGANTRSSRMWPSAGPQRPANIQDPRSASRTSSTGRNSEGRREPDGYGEIPERGDR